MTSSTKEKEHGSSERVENLVRQARLAAAVFTQLDQEQVDKIVKAMAMAAIENASKLALAAREETRMGVLEDKVLKNLVASEFLYNQIKNKRTVGVIAEYPEDNMVEIAEPMGVILALAPVTNPTSTVIFKSLCAAKTRNSIIFSPHLMAADSSNLTAKILYEAALKAGAPNGFITWVEKSSRLRRETEMMMVHKEVDLIFATGGTQMVKAAYSSGKPALGVGPGNTPVYLHKTAWVQSAVMDIIISKTFDNGTECPSEQTLIIDREVLSQALAEFQRLGCHLCSPDEVSKVAGVAIDSKTGGMNYRLVGQSAKIIADQAGIHVPEETKILLCPLDGDLRYHKLATEKLMPILGIVAVDSLEEGVNRALDINYAGGTGHTAGIFANDDRAIERFATAINAGRVIVNSPTSIGGLGGVYNNLSTTLSFGCGTGGGNITTDNVGIKNLLNYKRVPKRKNFTQTFQTTKNIYMNPGSIEHLRDLKCQSAFVVASGSAASRGHLAPIAERLPVDCRVDVFSQINSEPEWGQIEAGISMMRRCKPDTIIAVGGGSVIDAAKIMRLFYDCPSLTLEEVAAPFLDFRQRLNEFPKVVQTPLIAVPTTSGTGSEATPFAVYKNGQQKVTLVDESLLPTIAILDANLTRCLPPQITVDTAVDALTHALEALVSILATDYTDGLALEAIRLIFEALPGAVADGNNVLLRHKLHNAACLAGMAIGNALVGVNHSLAHVLGGKFNIPHGRANGVFLLSTLEYNSSVPSKFMPHSTHPLYVADQKYARAAQFLGLSGEPGCAQQTTQSLVLALRRGIYDLLRSVGQPLAIEELGIAKEEIENNLVALVEAAFNDMSMRSNPRMPIVTEVVNLFLGACGKRQRP